MATINVDYQSVTPTILAEHGVTLREVLRHSYYAQKAMKTFGIRNVTTIESVINKSDVPISSLFRFSPYATADSICLSEDGIHTERISNRSTRTRRIACKVYIIDTTYASLAWNKIYHALMKKVYPKFYETFEYTQKCEVDPMGKLETILGDFQNKTLKEVRATLNRKYYTKKISDLSIYADGNQFYLKLADNKDKSIYINYSDLAEAQKGNGEEAWNAIKNRVWYMGEKQGDAEWFKNSKTTAILHDIIMNMKK